MPKKSLKATATTTATRVGAEYKMPVSPNEPTTPKPPAGGAGSPMEIVFSFDTTGSMYSVLEEVRKNLSDMIKRLQDDIPNIKISVIAHGDYCDEVTSYIVKAIDFTADTDRLIHFVNYVEPTGGGDADECYELVLKTVRTQLSWSHGSQRALVMIGDANPHEPDYHFYTKHTPIDWKNEADKLFSDLGVHIYGVCCGALASETFYKTIAEKTEGTYLKMSEFGNILDLILAICYKEKGAEYFFAYEKEVRDREMRLKKTMNHDLDAMLVTLRKSASNASTMSVNSSDPPATPIVATKRPAPTAIVSPTPTKRAKVAPPPTKAPKKPSKVGAKKPRKVGAKKTTKSPKADNLVVTRMVKKLARRTPTPNK